MSTKFAVEPTPVDYGPWYGWSCSGLFDDQLVTMVEECTDPRQVGRAEAEIRRRKSAGVWMLDEEMS